ncbi:MAG: pilus (MSHA type) biogenesis protein MshL [Sulfuricaulis sp.]
MKRTKNFGMILRRAFAAMLAMLLAGCQSISPGWQDSVSTSMDNSFAPAPGGKEQKAVPAEVSHALLPPIEITLPQGGAVPLEPHFDLTVNNAPARQVFMGLVEGTPYSMIVDPDVTGTLSLNLKEVTVPEALSAIRQAYGYEYRREGNRFFILGNEIQTRLFSVNYLDLVRKGKSDTRVAASGLNGASTPGGGGATASSSGSSATSNGVQIETDTESDFWKGLTTELDTIVGTEGGRKVIVNPQAGIVLVRAMPGELRLVQDFLGKTQASMNRQVILEAKILEVQLNNGFQSGINWSEIMHSAGRTYTLGQVGGGTALSNGASEIAGNTGNLNPTTGTFSAVNGTATSAFGGVFTLATQSDNFASFIELLQSQGSLDVLSSPRVSTVNNQKAVIKVGTDEFFVTSETTTPSGTLSIQPTVTAVLSPFFSGISLDVTPQIDDAGNINLHIHPTISDVTDKLISIGGVGGVSQTITTAASAVQESDDIVRATSGQVVVIGGLMKETATDNNASVPLLGDIPVLGNLFKHKLVTRVKSELVILLKPTIITNGQDWSDAVDEAHERIRKIRIGS